MKRSRYTEEQTVFALNQVELGTPVPEVCRKMGVSDATFCNLSKKYGGGAILTEATQAAGGGESSPQ